jgi:hypothetical protein
MSGTIDHANLSIKFDIDQRNQLDLAYGQFAPIVNWYGLLANGTASGQASQAWTDTRTLGPSATENLDLAGSLINAFGTTLTFTKLKLLAIKADPANNVANFVQVTRPASNGVPFFLAASDGLQLSPGGIFIFYDPVGVTVTAATGDLITVTNGAGTNSVNYDVLVVGVD